MAKIDTSKITGYAEMSAEDKLKALEAFEYEDNAAELEKQKAAVSKANSEAAEWKRKHNALLGEDEKKKQEQEEKFANMEKELSELREAKRVSEFKAKFIAQGYDEVLAEDTAKAMADGDSAKVFANQQKFLDEYAKQVKADALKKTPKPTPGAGGGTGEMDYAKKIEEARTNGDFAAVDFRRIPFGDLFHIVNHRTAADARAIGALGGDRAARDCDFAAAVDCFKIHHSA